MSVWTALEHSDQTAILSTISQSERAADRPTQLIALRSALRKSLCATDDAAINFPDRTAVVSTFSAADSAAILQSVGAAVAAAQRQTFITAQYPTVRAALGTTFVGAVHPANCTAHLETSQWTNSATFSESLRSTLHCAQLPALCQSDRPAHHSTFGQPHRPAVEETQCAAVPSTKQPPF